MQSTTRRRKFELSKTSQRILSFRPIRLGGQGQSDVNVKQLLVFAEPDHMVISVVTDHGTVNIPLRRIDAAALASSLTMTLGREQPTKDDRPAPIKRRRIGSGR